MHRNYFNFKYELKTLTKTKGIWKYVDNAGKIWTELPTIGNKFHMPEEEYNFKTISGLKRPWSRKFLRDDNESGIGGEFELIIRHDNVAITEGKYLATYNFGRTRDIRRHRILDVNPHTDDTFYYYQQPNEKTIIIIERNDFIFDRNPPEA